MVVVVEPAAGVVTAGVETVVEAAGVETVVEVEGAVTTGVWVVVEVVLFVVVSSSAHATVEAARTAHKAMADMDVFIKGEIAYAMPTPFAETQTLDYKPLSNDSLDLSGIANSKLA